MSHVVRLARRLFAGRAPEAATASGALPFWADGGPKSRHLLAALPDRVDRVRVDALPHRGLLRWLRHRLGRRLDTDYLHVVLLAYDAGRNLERVDATAEEDPILPDVVVARYPAHWAFEGGDAEPVLHGTPAGRRALEAFAASQEPAPLGPVSVEPLASRMSRSRYDAAIAETLEGIAAGDYYEINLARRLEGAGFDPSQTLDLYLRLRQQAVPRHGALWDLGDGLWLASASPECLFTWDPTSRQAHSYPIKGTRPRHAEGLQDAILASELAASIKDRAEHLMIVDLVRNDLGRIAEPGSVRVNDLFGIHHLGAVHHMVTDVAAVAREGSDLVDVIAALFPGGSVTGAPKIAAMNAIERAEGIRRGFYCGSLGVIDRGGQAVFSILIRTVVAAAGRLLYQTGGAIVADSVATEEWAETEVKAAALMRALKE